MRPLFATAITLIFASACSAGPVPEPAAPAPPPAEPTPTPEAEPAAAPVAEDTPEPEAAAPAPRSAPDRWWYSTLENGVPGAAIDEAYQLLEGRSPAREIVVAIIDSGVDIDHEDLDDVLWTNAGEIPDNNVDDDGNGYVDDVHGWSFLGGSDGQSINFDTFELTRLHGACLGQAAGNGTPKPDEAVCAEVAEKFPERVAETTELAEQIGQLEEVYPIVLNILRNQIGAEPSVENVEPLVTFNPQVSQARDFFLQLAAAGLDEKVLADEGESIRGRLNFGLDPTFDPRPIVGDNYEDTSEREYGSPDVAGPDPSHGTSVASVAAAERNNGIGTDGAGDGISIMVVRAVPNGDERDKDVANAIRYAVDNGAHVLNMSFGKAYSPRRDVVNEAIRYAEEHGVLLVHASGNDSQDLALNESFPDHRHDDATTPELWIEVGASGWQGPDSLAATFTNYGVDKVHIFAPGVAIYAAGPGNEYGSHDGTSVAAPVITGIAGMLLAYFPELSTADVRTILLETATDVASNVVTRPGDSGESVSFGELSQTGGIVNARAAVERALR